MMRRTRAAAHRHARRTLPVNQTGALRLAVVADTHGRPHPAASGLIAAHRPDAILHAGDIGDLGVLDALAEVAPVHAVLGNIDDRASGLPDALTLTVTGEDGAPRVTLLITHIAVAGPRLMPQVAGMAQTERASLVVCGHSHVPFIGRDRGLSVFNPGSIGPRRFSLPIVFGLLELAAGRLSLQHVDCETGARWMPPAP
jgi:putative phosphoesterase